MVKKKLGSHGLVKEDYWSNTKRLCGRDLSEVPKNMQESLVEEQWGKGKGIPGRANGIFLPCLWTRSTFGSQDTVEKMVMQNKE